jgi:hypothetical protein
MQVLLPKAFKMNYENKFSTSTPSPRNVLKKFNKTLQESRISAQNSGFLCINAGLA